MEMPNQISHCGCWHNNTTYLPSTIKLDIKSLDLKYFQWAAVDKKKWREGAVVKGRNEPHTIRQVLEIIAAVKEEDPQELAEKIYANTEKIFFS